MKIESEMSKNNNLSLKWNKIWFKVIWLSGLFGVQNHCQ